MQAIQDQQEVMGAIADMVIETYCHGIGGTAGAEKLLSAMGRKLLPCRLR